jgi:hypothetical protein
MKFFLYNFNIKTQDKLILSALYENYSQKMCRCHASIFFTSMSVFVKTIGIQVVQFFDKNAGFMLIRCHRHMSM